MTKHFFGTIVDSNFCIPIIPLTPPQVLNRPQCVFGHWGGLCDDEHGDWSTEEAH